MGTAERIEYKGYTGVFEYDPEIESFHGRVVDLREVITFYGKSVNELKEEMAISVDTYLESCAGDGWSPSAPMRCHPRPELLR